MEKNKTLLPIAIVVAGLLIAGALYFGGNGNSDVVAPKQEEPRVKAVDSTDHILGNLQAKVKLIEFADTQCRFCRAFHPTMKQIMSEYGEGGKVAWVYRHFAILGPQSEVEARATECAAELGGDEKFWQYLDLLFDSKDETTRLPASITLEDLAEDIELDTVKFNECMESDRHTDTLSVMREDAIAAGAKGTPYTVMTDLEGNIVTIINGAQPIEAVKAAIEQALK